MKVLAYTLPHLRSFLKSIVLFATVVSVFVLITSFASMQQLEPNKIDSTNPDLSIFTTFDNWVKNRARSLISNRQDDELGESLAIKRRETLQQLIQVNPQEALNHTITKDDYDQLPSSITKHLEKRISGYGDFLVYVLDEFDSSTEKLIGSRTERQVVIGNDKYKAVVYGRRLEMTTKFNIPLQGIVIDDIMIVDESPVRKISAKGIDDKPAANTDEISAEVGGKVVKFSGQAELENFVRKQVEWESKVGPVQPKTNDSSYTPWTLGLKKVLFIRVDFPDRVGEPVDNSGVPLSQSRAQSLMDNEVNPFYVSNSYGQTSLETTVTAILRMPRPITYYSLGQNFNFTDLFGDAFNIAESAGFELSKFQFRIIAFSRIPALSFAGLGSGDRAILNGNFSFIVTAHELGHCYGLSHANLWRTTDGTVIGSGTNIEYGDPFDVMGSALAPQYHFNSHYKRRMEWLTDSDVQVVTRDNTYRVFAHDSSLQGGTRVLKIKKNSGKNYWVEFKQLITNNPNVMSGATVRWDYLRNDRGLYSLFKQTQLLDMTPDTSAATDAPLLIGQSFYDNEDRIRITVLGKGNTTPESLDIKVELNVGCSFNLGQTIQSFPSSGGEDNITVNTQSGCRPPTTSNDSWLYAEPTDIGAVRYVVAANDGSQPRIGTITIAEQTFTIQQGAATTVCSAPPSGLVAWWQGELNATDRTGVNNGTLIGNMTFGGGRVGGGFKGNYFNPSIGIVEVPDSPSLALKRSMTFEGWLRLDSYGGTVIERRDDFRFSGNFYPTYYVTINSLGRLNFFIGYENQRGTGASTPDPLPLNQFVHFGATLDDATSQMKIYINGSLVRQTTITERPYDLNPDANPRVYIGNISGVTDELSVYNRALSASEIQAIYNAGTASTGAAGKCTSINKKTSFDLDGDGKTDYAIYRPSVGEWWYLRSGDGGNHAFLFGSSNDRIVPADYTGDGKTDVAFFRPSTREWFILRSEDSSFFSAPFGATGDIPVPGDYDGDGKADIAVFRPSEANWYINRSSGGFTILKFGSNVDIPVPADFDGDGKADLAVYRQSVGEWWYLRSSDGGNRAFQFGNSSDKPIPGDYTGDGKTDVAFYRPQTSEWFVLRSEDSSFYSAPFGAAGDVPVVGDYDGDGKADIAVWRESDRNWYIAKSSGGFAISTFGAAGDKPVPAAFVP